MHKNLLNGQVTIVTGGSSGIGLAVSLSLAREGAHVVVLGRSPTRVQDTVRLVREMQDETNSGASVLGLVADVRRERDTERMARETLAVFGQIDALVTSAGILRGVTAEAHQLVDLLDAEWDEVLETNLTGVFLSNRAVLPAMIRQRRGNIVNVSSTSGLKGLAYDAAYCASKFGVIGMSQALAEEVSHYGVRVQVVLPGPVDTPIWRQNELIPSVGPALLAERVADAILRLLGSPEDVSMTGTCIYPLHAENWSKRVPFENFSGCWR
jgi:NAD(P)-dependent dehydrogenase (short-subunit alcohol dehydrogenase family)